MAATGYTPIKLYASTTAAAVPLAINLDNTNGAELAINITDGKLYYKDNAGVVQVIAGKGGAGVAGGSNTQVQFNSSGSLAGSASLTWDGTYLTAASIKDTALSSGQIVYTGGSGLLVTSNNLTYAGTDLANLNGDISIGASASVTTRMFRAYEVGTVGNNAGIAFGNAGGKGAIYGYSGGSGINIVSGNSGPIAFGYATGGADATANFLSLGAWTTTGLGIGTTSPAYTLDVVGRARIGIAGSVPALTLVSGTNGSADVFVSNNTTGLRLVGGTVIGTDSQILLGGSASGTSTNIYFDGAVKTFRNTSGSSDQMVITSAGLVGIGTSSPNASYRMTLSGTTTGVIPGIVFNNTQSAKDYSLRVVTNDFILRDVTNGVDRLQLDTSGNLGLGVVPNSWNAYQAFQFGTNGSVSNYGPSGDTYLSTNAYYQSGWKYITTGLAASGLQVANGGFSFNTAASGTAGAAISYSTAMLIDSTGKVGIGQTSPQAKLDVRASNIAIGVTALATAQGQAFVGTTDNWGQDIGGTLALGGAQNSGTLTQTFASIAGRRESSLGYIYTGYMQLAVSDGANMVERMRIASNGYVGINQPAPLDLLHLNNGVLRISGTTPQAIYIYGGAGIKPYIDINEYGVSDYYIGAGTSAVGTLSINNSLGGVQGIHIKASNGKVGIGVTNPSLGNLEIQATSTGAGLWVQTGGTTSAYTVADFRTGTNYPALTIFGEGAVCLGVSGSYNSAKLSVAGEAEIRGNMRSYYSQRGGLAAGGTVNVITVPNGSYGQAISLILYVQQRNDNIGNLSNYQYSITGWGGSSANVTTSSTQAYGAGSPLSVSVTGASGGLIITLTNSSGSTSTTLNMTALVLVGYDAITWGW